MGQYIFYDPQDLRVVSRDLVNIQNMFFYLLRQPQYFFASQVFWQYVSRKNLPQG